MLSRRREVAFSSPGAFGEPGTEKIKSGWSSFKTG